MNNDQLKIQADEESAVYNVSTDELQDRLANYEKKSHLQSEEIHILRKELSDYRNKFSLQEAENESLRRIIERSNVENDGLLQKLDSISSSARIHEENANILKTELKSLQEQNQNLRSSLSETNLARDEVVEKLKQVSIETRELIENCEKASEEVKIFKSKSETLEEGLRNTTSHNELLLRENEDLRSQIRQQLVRVEARSCKDTNNDNESCTEKLCNAVTDESKKSNRTPEELEREIILSRQDNENLLARLQEKDDIIAKQSVDFFSIKNRVDEYHAEIVRLDEELKDCRSRVCSLNENLKSINAENLDLAEYTYFKNWHKKFAHEENIDKLLSKLQMLREIEELFNSKLAPGVNSLFPEPSNDRNNTNVETNADAINKIKTYLERALYAIEKLNEKNMRITSEYEADIRTKNDEISRLKEILSHTSLYNEILEQTLKQCRENAKIDRFVEEKTDELITANKALLDNFDELRKIYRVSHSYNGLLFAKYHQLNLCYKILKINLAKILPPHESSRQSANEEQASSPSVAKHLNDAIFLMDELLEEILAHNVDFDLRTNQAENIFNNYEVSLATKDYLKNTVDDMTQEVKRLTCRVEQEMAEKIREIESLRNEIDSMKTDNRELVNKIKSCNREIISLSTENYDLNEKLATLPEMEKKFENLKNELSRVKNTSHVEQIKQIYQQCRNLKENNANLRNEISSLNENATSEIFQLVEILRCRTMPSSGVVEPTNLLRLRNQCAEFKQQNRLLKEAVYASREQVLQEICSIRKAFDTSNISNHQVIDWKSNLENLHAVCEHLKQQHNDMKRLDCLKPVGELLEAADATITTKLQRLSHDFQTVQNDLNSALVDKEECQRLICSRCVTILKLVQDLKALCTLLSTLAKEIPKKCADSNAVVLKVIQEAISHTFQNMKLSFTRSNEEIIKEMQEMNLELKKRGETISTLNHTFNELDKEKKNLSDLLAQQESVSSALKTELCRRDAAVDEKNLQVEQLSLELSDLRSQFEREIRDKDTELSKLSATLETISIELRSKEETITALENELSKSKDIQDGDVSSMGNISRTEEVSRLRDVEESFEERYMKLRCIAIKMKKNIAELNQQLKNEKTERAVVQSKLSAALEQAKRTQALQEECDRITDDLDIKTKEIKELKKIIAEADKQNDEIRRQCDSLTEKIEFLSNADEHTKAEKKNVEVDIKNLTSQLKNLKEEKFVQETLKNEKDKEVQSLKQKLKETEDYNKKLVNDLEQAKLEARKQGALTLEMRDYEKTISDLTDKLKKKQIINEELTEKLKLSTESNVSFVERIKQLEEQISSYGASNKIADEQILQLNKIISTHEKNLEDKDVFVKRLTQQLEEEKSNNEKLTLHLADSISKFDSLKESNKTKENLLNNQLKSSQNKITILEETVKKKDIEFDKLKEDFESYKIRAHNVLQKLKSPNNSKQNEEKLKNEIDNLSRTVNELRKRLDETLNELEKQKTEMKLVETAKEKLQSRMKEMNEANVEKTKELDNMRIELKSYKLNSETLIKCYKDEIERLQNECEKHKANLKEFKTANEVAIKVAQSKNDNVAKPLEENEEFSSREKNTEYSKNEKRRELRSKNESENSTRERNRKHSMISLEKLLEPNDVEENRGDEAELRKKVKLLENQVTYLNGILNESEKNAARNEQQVTLLKDEIRRLQKIIERAPHLQNGEYLKNVLFNFFTFPDGEEKCRLITILETLLQLTSEETETLSSIAKGYRVEQKRTSGSGLSSMLKLW